MTALKLMSRLPAGAAGMVLLDPPPLMGIGSSDEGVDNTAVDEMIGVFAPLAEEVMRVLQYGGACVVIGEALTVTAWEVAAYWAGLQLAAEMVVLWDRRHDRRRTGEIASFSTGVRWYVRPGYRHAVSGGRYGGEDREIRVSSNVIVCRSVPLEERENANQKPVELYNYLVSLLTEPDDVVVDPMCGAGSALVAAEMCGRGWVGCDVDERQTRVARKRVQMLELEDAHLRPLCLWQRGRLTEVVGNE